MSPPTDDHDQEAARQQWLLTTLWQRGLATDASGWLRPLRRTTPPSPQDGVQAYRTNGYAAAQAALAASFPTVAALVGDQALGLLARAYRQDRPPTRGDLAWFGADLPAFISASAELAELPYLADVARLDWALAQAETAPDVAPDAESAPATLALLGEHDPDTLWLQLVPGAVRLASRWPVVTIWQAHQRLAESPAERTTIWAPVRAALAAGQGEAARVWRSGWRACAAAVAPPEAALLDALLAGASLGAALQAAGPELDFGAWLARALQDGLLLGAALEPRRRRDPATSITLDP